MKRLMTVLALAFTAACAAQAHTDEHKEEAPPAAPAVVAGAAHASTVASSATVPSAAAATCDIRATRTARGVRMEAIAHAVEAMRGEYQFVITAQGPGGSSDVTQGGPFALEAGRSATIGSAEISSLRYRAVLALRDAGGDLCRIERRA